MLNIPEETEETKAFWALFAEELSRPLPPIPLEDTPIYAALKAEYDARADHVPSLNNFRAKRKALLKKGSRR